MKKEGWWGRRIFAGGATMVIAATGACLSIDWPTTVASGPGGRGASSETEEAGIVDAGEDASFDATGITGFICLVPAANLGGLEECSTWQNLTSDEVQGYVHECTALAPIGSVLPQGTPCPSGVLGCCQLQGAQSQECYYQLNFPGQPTTSQTGCENTGGTWSTQPLATPGH